MEHHTSLNIMYGDIWMKYIINIPKWQDIRIKRIFADENSDYSSIEDFVIVACENQIKIEEGENGEHNLVETATAKPNILNEKFESLLNSDISTVPTVPIPSREKVETTLIWGQINRIFPIKLGIRLLADMIREENTNYVDLEDFREKAADVAREFGLKLKALDEQNRRKSGEKFSTGLPIGNKTELSKNRYKAHYLGYQTGKGTLEGALANLRLANINNDKIGITAKGLEFANQKNPLFDLKEANPRAILSENEIKCYLSLASEFLSEEPAFMKTVLGIIKFGEPAREEFNFKIKEFLEKTWKKEITDAVANTMRSGVLSRMWELKLVSSKRLGKSVVYSITEDGKKYLNN